MFRFALSLLFVSVVCAALLLGIVRLFLPLASEYRGAIEQAVSQALGKPVRLGGIEAEWIYLDPSLTLQGVTILDSEGRNPLITIKRVHADIDIFRSILEWSPRFHAIRFSSANFTIIRNSQGKIMLLGFQSSGESFNTELTDLLASTEFELIASSVFWQDKLLDHEYRIEDVNLGFKSSANSHRLIADIELPEALAKSLKLSMNFHGDLADMANWEGELYVDVQQLNLKSLPGNLLAERFGAKQGEVSLESWSNWSGGHPEYLRGNIQVRDLHIAPHNKSSSQASMQDLILPSLQTQFRWQQHESGWLLDMDNLLLSSTAREWPRSGFNLDYKKSADDILLSAAIDYLRIDDVLPFATHQDLLNQQLLQTMEHLAPSGDLANFRVDLQNKSESAAEYSASGKLVSLKINATDDLPGLSGLQGTFSLDQLSGEAEVESQAFVFTYPRMFENSLSANDLSARLRWSQTQHATNLFADRFSLTNSDIDVRGKLGVTLDDSSPYLEMKIGVMGGNAGNFERYVPLTLKPNLQDWLKNGIVDGDIKNGTVEFKGRPEDFPFYHDEGLMDVKLSVENAVVNYKPGWPQLSKLAGELTWHNQSLDVIASHASILNSTIDSAQFRIDDIKRANINISANAKGPLQDIQDYFTAASLISADPAITREFKFTGPANLELDMLLPVTKIPEAMVKRQISGKLKLANSGIKYEKYALNLNNINGTFQFDDNGVTANGVKAALAGQPVEFDARPKPGGRTELTGLGMFNPRTFLSAVQVQHPLLDTLQGSSNWKTVLDLPSMSSENSVKTVGVSLSSNLQGITVSLPEPFSKSEAEIREFVFTTQFSSGENHPFAIEYGDSVSAMLLRDRNSSNDRVYRAELRINRGKATLPEKGVAVRASLDNFSLSQWQDVLQSDAEFGNSRIGQTSAGFPLDYLDADINSLELAGFQLGEFKIQATRAPQAWEMNLDSTAVKGSIEIPHDRTDNQPIIAALDHLVLDAEFGGPDEAKSLDPAKIPALRLSTHKLRYKTFDFTEVNMETKPIDNGIKLQYLQLAGSDLQGHVSGTWQKINDLQSSEFEFDLESEDISKALESLHIENSFSGGKASAVGTLQWPYAPYQLEFDGLRGMARVEISDGRLKKIKPGAARLLGLFNISTLQRRLSLNFKDIFKKGLAFDTIDGDLRFEDSNVFTDNLKMEGPSAKIAIQGRTGLLAKDYDQIVKVNPEISAGLPVAGALIGGPILGAAVLVAEKIGEHLGQDIDKLVTLEYKVTGSWDDPHIEEVVSPPQKSFAPETSSPVK